VSIDVAPVTSTGHASPGFTVNAERGGNVSCSPSSPSPSAISKNIEECYPTAEYAVACWKSAAAGKVLCMRDPRKKQLSSIKLSGKFAPTAPVSKAKLSPFVIVLTDGDSCEIRIGGTGGILKSHPHYFTSYYCAKDGVVWSKPNATHSGVDETGSSWTVQTASGTGTGKLVTRHVARAYYVATAS
jgi:hypothetical protein